MAKFAQMRREHSKLIVSLLTMVVGWWLFDVLAGDWFLSQQQIVGSDPIHLTMLCLVKFALVLAFGALGFAAPILAASELLKSNGIVKIPTERILGPELLAIVAPFGTSFRPPRQFS